ncbi:Pyruvate/2-oxoglutarate dehydrogenase complex, dihydrolipoamide dehydrogenase (E3) component [Actinomyces ruminicola]|uniref:Pyruvate/2-oxoglutarate dehydrogenase complex, dihydrolipoamide dehydrogenase (E3) component n=1 Tax=Actinomyces ruminicola TaxID=332524 RepID=A0A1H0D882_9ACTO|nr:FAD-dependent oxidoreductase [Actinomyces ruminicola]SDN66171.1 Pyruvate/2-oxoglutarate dehydrogenase complex, dihydrolipoamide dehydrogenase (E3) component [Actinomyces ruminicola]
MGVTDTTVTASGQVQEVDLLVVGGGKAGKSLAMARARKGDDVVMVERDKVGGTCINVACIPTKTLITSARVLHQVQGAGAYGVALPELGADDSSSRDDTALLTRAHIDLKALRARKEAVVGGMVAAHETMFADSGLDFVRGSARFIAPRTVEIATADGAVRRVRGRRVLINTGTTPALPAIPGLADAPYWTSEDLLGLPELPGHLIILGGGVIGVEMASLMGMLGVPVTLLHSGEHVLNREDADVAAEVAAGLEALGVEILTGARVNAVRCPARSGPVVVRTEDGREATGSHLLVALGRTPVTAGLGLEAAGVELTERGFVRVDDHLRTTAEGVYAAGDVAGSPMFTHASWNDFRVLRDLLDGREASTAGRVIPWTVFTTPELGHVGLTEAQARETGHNVRVAKTPTAAVPRARTLGATGGFYKLIIDADTDLILGAAIIGESAGEVITAVQVAMLAGMPWQQLRDAPISHPTMGEGLNLVLDSLG